MRSDTAFFSALDISRRFLRGLTSALLSGAVAAAFLGEEDRRDLDRDDGADAPRICSTSLNALISPWRRSISSWRSAMACAMTFMDPETSGLRSGCQARRATGGQPEAPSQ